MPSRDNWLPLSYDALRDKNVNLFKKLNSVIFPLQYKEKLYQDCIAAGNVTQLAYCLPTDILVAGIGCRYEKKEGGKARLYIMTLGVLAPYRGRGVGQRLLVRALNEASKDPNVDEAYLHVQTNNTEAIDFYKKFGFQITEKIPDYYKKLDPPDCYVLSLSLKDFTPLEGYSHPEDDESTLTQ